MLPVAVVKSIVPVVLNRHDGLTCRLYAYSLLFGMPHAEK